MTEQATAEPGTEVAVTQGAPMQTYRPAKEALSQIEKVVIEGDLATLSPGERIAYYARVCESLGLNPLTLPFLYTKLQSGKLSLYAKKDTTDQLRKIHGVNIDRIERDRDDELGMMTVTAYGHDRSGRTDSSIGVVSIVGLKGDALANAMMKAETKAKRRMTLSLVGLGWLDESELETANAMRVNVDPQTGEIEAPPPAAIRTTETRSRIRERTAAMRGEAIDTGESDAGASRGAVPGVADEDVPVESSEAPGDSPAPREEAVYEGEVIDVDDIPFDGAAAEPLSQPDTGGSEDARPPALPSDPDTMRTYAAAVLELDTSDVWGLADLDQTDWERVWAALAMPAGDEYAAWYGRLDRPMRAALMQAKQSPRLRAEWAKA